MNERQTLVLAVIDSNEMWAPVIQGIIDNHGGILQVDIRVQHYPDTSASFNWTRHDCPDIILCSANMPSEPDGPRQMFERLKRLGLEQRMILMTVPPKRGRKKVKCWLGTSVLDKYDEIVRKPSYFLSKLIGVSIAS